MHHIVYYTYKIQEKLKKTSRNSCIVRQKVVPLHSQLGNHSSVAGTRAFWRDGRVVDCIGLENRRTERYRGFESLSLRQVWKELAEFQRVFFLLAQVVPKSSPFCTDSFSSVVS